MILLSTINDKYKHNFSDYGVGYAWSSKTTSISVGDTVTWKWEKASALSQLLYNVFQLSSALDKEYDGKGFNSGGPSDKGKIILIINASIQTNINLV